MAAVGYTILALPLYGRKKKFFSTGWMQLIVGKVLIRLSGKLWAGFWNKPKDMGLQENILMYILPLR